MTVEILILAAGASTRMRGADKLLQPVHGQPLITHVARQAVATGQPVTVALAPDRPERTTALHGLPLARVIVPDPSQGMAASLTAGLAALPPGPVLLLLADLPDLTTADLCQMIDASQATPDLILRATAQDGTPGHPVIFPSWARPALLTQTGDQGPRGLLATHKDRVRLIALPGTHATTDLDTPEAWSRWRAQHPE
ncbi:MAG: nucleotidyltransferase family protein [Paracoccaceae bacterium]